MLNRDEEVDDAVAAVGDDDDSDVDDDDLWFVKYINKITFMVTKEKQRIAGENSLVMWIVCMPIIVN